MIKVIYLPGLGDHRRWFQDKLIKLWRLFGLNAEYQSVGWADDEPFEDKLKRIVDKIDELASDGHKVALVGVSAGASAAHNAYSLRRDKISAVVFICGKVKGTDNINPNYFKQNPAFRDSIFASDRALQTATEADKSKMLYLYCVRDKTVGPQYNRIKGIGDRKIFGLGHISGIFITLILHGRMIAKFIKNRSKISD